MFISDKMQSTSLLNSIYNGLELIMWSQSVTRVTKYRRLGKNVFRALKTYKEYLVCFKRNQKRQQNQSPKFFFLERNLFSTFCYFSVDTDHCNFTDPNGTAAHDAQL